MPNTFTVSELKTLPPGKDFSGLFILKKRTERTARTGSPFYTVEMGDRTGTFSCTVFSDSQIFAALRSMKEGVAVHVEGTTGKYQDRFSPHLDDLFEVSEEEIARDGLAELLVEVSPENYDDLCAELAEHIEAIEDEPLRETTRDALKDAGEVFQTSSAAISMHHAYRHGLLEHSCHLARVARALLPLYPQVNPSLALAGTLLHDIGKTLEYTQGLSTRRTRLGILQGHVVLGYRCVRRQGIIHRLAPEILERLEHIILSHQGELEWGAATLAATPEAVFVSLIDNFDAKMGMVQAALRNTPSSEEFSEYIAGLRTVLLVEPPFPQSKKKAEEAEAEPDGNATEPPSAEAEEAPGDFLQ